MGQRHRLPYGRGSVLQSLVYAVLFQLDDLFRRQALHAAGFQARDVIAIHAVPHMLVRSCTVRRPYPAALSCFGNSGAIPCSCSLMISSAPN